MWPLIECFVELSQHPLSDELEELQLSLSDGLAQPYYRFLYHLTKYLNPDVCLEIGVYRGVGSAMMLNATKNLVIGIDINETSAAKKLQRQFKNYRYIIGDSIDSYSEVKKLIKKKKIGILYQDSSHHYLPSRKEFELYGKHVNGIWICDDITPSFHDPHIDPPYLGMVQYFENLPGDKRLYDNLHHGNTQGITLINS